VAQLIGRVDLVGILSVGDGVAKEQVEPAALEALRQVRLRTGCGAHQREGEASQNGAHCTYSHSIHTQQKTSIKSMVCKSEK
jgi:hypothetical protein